MKSADFTELKNWATECERLLFRELHQAQNAYTLNTVGACAMLAFSLWLTASVGRDSWVVVIVYLLALSLGFRAHHNGVDTIKTNLLAVEKLIGMQHYASAIN